MSASKRVMWVPRRFFCIGVLCSGDCHFLVEFIICTLPETKSEPDSSRVRTSSS